MKSSLSKRKGAKAFAKLVVNSSSEKVLGAHFVGPEAAEIIQVRLLITSAARLVASLFKFHPYCMAHDICCLVLNVLEIK